MQWNFKLAIFVFGFCWVFFFFRTNPSTCSSRFSTLLGIFFSHLVLLFCTRSVRGWYRHHIHQLYYKTAFTRMIQTCTVYAIYEPSKRSTLALSCPVAQGLDLGGSNVPACHGRLTPGQRFTNVVLTFNIFLVSPLASIQR